MNAVKPKTLVTISSDPRTSARPAEAIRIAAGIGAWEKTDVTVFLRGSAPYILSDELDELVDEDHFVHYLPMIAERGQPFYVLDDFPEPLLLAESNWSHKIISLEEAAKLYLQHQSFIQM